MPWYHTVNLSQSHAQSSPHGLIDLHLYHGLGGIGTSILGGRGGGFGSLVVGGDEGGIEIVELDGLGAHDVRSRILMSQRKSPRDEILLVLSIPVLDRQHARLHLRNDRNVIRRHLVLSHGTRHDDRRDLGGIVQGFLGKVEVQFHDGTGRGGGGEGATEEGRGGGGGGDAAEVGDHHGRRGSWGEIEGRTKERERERGRVGVGGWVGRW
mmetsp:Transcript_20659/g.33551  ORF Transcript_20659/g.33551 Transcript_20659/m.33551 type:complete len:210 (-) Transcript_20659:10-639(-)